jgi:quinol-cytochrome oxidoreductase complex cytochrome b subunit
VAKVIAIWGLTAVVAAIVAGILAGIKRRDWSFWVGTCFLLPPLVLFLALLPAYHTRPKRRTLDEEDAATGNW